MLQHRTKLLLALFALIIFSTACKHNMSPDTPLDPVYTPSIIIGSDNRILYAFDPATGNKNWELAFPGPMTASPLLYNGMLYIGLQSGLVGGADAPDDTLYKVNAKTGKIVKKMVILPHEFYSYSATPVADGNLIYLATTNDTLYAIDTGTGVQKWAYGTGGPITSSPTVHNGNVYFGGTDGYIYCLDKTLGTLTWKYHAGTGVKFNSSVAIGDPYLFIGASDSSVYSMFLTSPTTTGVNKWVYKTGGAVNSSPTAYGGVCTFGCDDFHIYCVDTATGIARWIDSAGDRIISSPIADNQVFYVGSYDTKFYAIDIISGGIKWTFATSGLIKSCPVVYGGNVYIGSYDKYLYALDTATGNIRWKTNINGLIECSPVVNDLEKVTGYNSGISGNTQ